MLNATLKVVIVGDSRVGKSQLCRRVTNRSFEVYSTIFILCVVMMMLMLMMTEHAMMMIMMIMMMIIVQAFLYVISRFSFYFSIIIIIIIIRRILRLQLVWNMQRDPSTSRSQ